MEVSAAPTPTWEERRAAYAWMAASAVLFATMNFFARLVGEGGAVPWAHVGATRAFTGALIAFAVARARGARLTTRDKKGMWWRSALGTASMVCTFYALSRRGLPLGDTTTLLNLTPVFLAFLTPHLLGERTGGRVFVALVVSLGGAVLLLRPSFLFGGHGHTPDAWLTGGVATLAAIFAAFAMIMLRKLGKTESPEAVAVHFSLFAAATMTLLSLPTLALPRPRDAAYMVLAGVAAGVAQICMTRAYALERAARVAAVGYLAVAVSAGLGAAWLHEIPRPTAFLGMALVVAGGLVVALNKRA
ncbi:MAG: DMT family transporter [Polyangiaceae bacterium]